MRNIIEQQIDDGPREQFIECPECRERLDKRVLREVMDHQCDPADIEFKRATLQPR